MLESALFLFHLIGNFFLLQKKHEHLMKNAAISDWDKKVEENVRESDSILGQKAKGLMKQLERDVILLLLRTNTPPSLLVKVKGSIYFNKFI